MTFSDLKVINDFMFALASTASYINVESIGKSTEGRETNCLKITKAGAGRPIILVEGGKTKST